MTFESTDWEFSNMTDVADFIQVEPGDQYLYIESATYDPEACNMDINFKSLTNGATFRIRYFMLTKEGKQNSFTGRVLKSLGRAINDEDKVLAPCDIEGAVVRANVQMTVPKEEGGKSYPKVEEYLPIDESIMQYSGKPDQYFLKE